VRETKRMCSHRGCQERAIINEPATCTSHITEVVENHVRNTITEHNLIHKDERVCVAASGGKDSITLLHILKKNGYVVDALAIDEGIRDYREHTLTHLRTYCEEHNIPLRIVSFADEIGSPLDSMIKNNHPCSVCGVYRRMLLNKHAQEYDVIATGHNLDDESQVVLMNLITANKNLTRTHIRTPKKEGFTPRIKPLMFTSEKAIRAYTYTNSIDVSYDECPYVKQSLRAKVRDELNTYESHNHGMKQTLVNAALRASIQTTKTRRSSDSQECLSCELCGQPSTNNLCRACMMRQEQTSQQ
jgi:uncharacterized protein (TIGR00269 family)